MFGLFKKRKKLKKDEEVKEIKSEEIIVEKAPENPIAEEKDKQNFVEEIEDTEDLEETSDEATSPQRKSRKPINHITKHKDGGWKIKKEGAQRALKRFSTQKEAIEFAKELEKTTGTTFIIHKANGATRKKTYK